MHNTPVCNTPACNTPVQYPSARPLKLNACLFQDVERVIVICVNIVKLRVNNIGLVLARNWDYSIRPFILIVTVVILRIVSSIIVVIVIIRPRAFHIF